MIRIAKLDRRLLIVPSDDHQAIADFVGMRDEPVRMLEKKFEDVSEALAYVECLDGYHTEIAESALEPADL